MLLIHPFLTNGKVFNNDEFRFSIDIPSVCIVNDDYDEKSNLLLTAKSDMFFVEVYAYKAQKDNRYDYKKIVDQLSTDGFDSLHMEYEPWTNLLRNKITLSGQIDGAHLDRLVTFRARTLFDIQIYSTAGVGSVKESIFQSVDLDMTIYSKLQILISSIGIIMLVLFPTLYFNIFYFLGLALRKCKNSKDPQCFILAIVLSVIVLVLTALCLYYLRQDMTFAIILIAVLLGLGICIMTGNEFLKSFVKSIIS